MISRRRLLASLLAGSLLLSVTACVPGMPGNGAAQKTGAVVTTAPPTSAAVVATVTVVNSAPFAPTHRPSYDPILASGHWGIVSRSEAGITDSGERTNTKHEVIKQDQINSLTEEQGDELQEALERSAVVKSLIKENGGSASDVTYYVREIFADADTGVDTAWVTATLRADFPAVGGRKGIELQVYQQKTSKGLDNHPYVTSTLVGYVSNQAALSSTTSNIVGDQLLNPTSLRFK